MTISVIIPSIGRACLKELLEELVVQLIEGDEIIVVGDGPQPEAKRISDLFAPKCRYIEYGPDHAWGHPQRNAGMKAAKGSHVMTLDDDDAVTPNALESIRRAISETPDRPLIFKIQNTTFVIWEKKEIKLGHVSTQMFVIPNVPERLGTWGRRYQGDFDFIRSTLARYPGRSASVVWKEDLIAIRGISGVPPLRQKPETDL